MKLQITTIVVPICAALFTLSGVGATIWLQTALISTNAATQRANACLNLASHHRANRNEALGLGASDAEIRTITAYFATSADKARALTMCVSETTKGGWDPVGHCVSGLDARDRDGDFSQKDRLPSDMQGEVIC